MHAGRGLPGPDGPEYGHAGVQAPLRDGEPGGVGDLPDGDRMMEFSDHDSGAGIAGLQGPIRKYPQGGEAPGAGLEKYPPARQENKPHQHDRNEGREVVPPDHPEVEAGGMVGHEIEDRIGPEQGEGSVEKPPSRAYQADQKKDHRSREPHKKPDHPPTDPTDKRGHPDHRPAQDRRHPNRVSPVHRPGWTPPQRPQNRDRILPAHRVFLRRVSAASVGLFRAFPQG